MNQRGSILVGLLWCLVLLSVVVISVLHASRIDLLVARNHADTIQAHYLARAGIERAIALLYHDARDRSRSARHHTGNLHDAPEQFQEIPLGRGTWSVLRKALPHEAGPFVFGVQDEEGRFNVNTAPAEDFEPFRELHGVAPDVIAAILDWRDTDNLTGAGGAEIDHYASLVPPRRCRNGPFESVRELLMVRGITSELLYGVRLARGDRDPTQPPDDPQSASAGPSWADHLTVHSVTSDLNASGQDRVNVQSADEAALTSVRGITADIARAIVAWRNNQRLESIAHLLDVTAPAPGGGGGGVPQPGGIPGQPAPGRNAAPSGPPVIDEDLLIEIADDITVHEGGLRPGLININTAPVEVLDTLPGIDRQLAHAIISHRQSGGYFPNIAALLRVPGFNPDLLKQIASRITVRSETFRILGEGHLRFSGARRRIEVVVHIGLNDVELLAYREDNL